MNQFFNRHRELDQILKAGGIKSVLIFYGEKGIGKTELLTEARKTLIKRSPPPVVINIDFQDLVKKKKRSIDIPLDSLKTELAKAIRPQILTDTISTPPADPDLYIGEMLQHLIGLAQAKDAYVFYDTTELVQENLVFWKWLEEAWVGPLVIQPGFRQVLAGRVPAPLRRVEVKGALLAPIPLGPLSTECEARSLALAALQNARKKLPQDQREDASEVILEFSCGHPSLTEKLAQYLVGLWPPKDLAAFKHTLCQQEVKPFINSLFDETDVSPDWIRILWWVCILEWFDATILQYFLIKVEPDMVADKQDYFYIRGISELRVHNHILWKSGDGDQLQGVIGKIMTQCLKTLDPQQYIRAHRAAAETLKELAGEYDLDTSEANYLIRQAEYHQLQILQEANP